MSNPVPTDRRQDRERRAGGERRRSSDDRHVTIEVCDSQLHVAITVRSGQQAKPLLVTRTIDWRQQASFPHTAAGAAELAAAFKALAVEQRISGCETTVLLGARLCVTRTATASLSEIDRQVKELEERGQLYLALGGGEVCVSKSIHAIDARHMHALVSMANQRVIDAVADAAHQAGLNLRRVESSMVALCRTHAFLHPQDDSPVLLVMAHPNGLSIGAALRGRLLLEYLPGGSPSPGEVRGIVEKHLGRFQRICQRAQMSENRELKLAYISGSTEAAEAAALALNGFEDVRIHMLLTDDAQQTWETRGERLRPENAATLGGLLLKLLPDQFEEGPNLLENWIRESRKHIRPILLRSAAPLAAVLLIAAVVLGMNVSLAMRNGRLQDQVAAAQPLKNRYRQLRLDLAAAEAKLHSLEDLAEGLPTTSLPEVVRRVGQCLPSDVWLERLAVTDQADATIAGSGFTESGVFEFVGHMESLPGASNAALQDTGVRQGAQGPVTSFNMSVVFEPGLESHPPQEQDHE